MNEAVNVIVPLLAPMMPPLAEECWTVLGHDTLVAGRGSAGGRTRHLVEDMLALPVQINGKKRAK